MKKNLSTHKVFGLKPLTVACLMVAGTSTQASTFNANNINLNDGWVWTGGSDSTNYVTPINTQAPNYHRGIDKNLEVSQPKASTGTITGYSSMDEQSTSKLTQAFYHADQDDYANRLRTLKNSIDTRNMRVGVIDSGVNRNNKDMIGANVHNTQIYCLTKEDDNCYLPHNDSAIGEMQTDSAFTHHGSHMASIIAGNNGMTNAQIYSSASVGEKSNGGNQFLMMQQLNKKHNIKIFNNSWGSDNSDAWYTDAQNSDYNRHTGEITYGRNDGKVTNAEVSLAALHDLILNRDALVIKATGNERLRDAHDENLAPLINGDFKKGFITVSSPREDFNSANFCGRTAEWCLAATSSSSNYNNDNSIASYQGTSPATARVTGTAVLVKAAYPWMKNENLVHTILGTAKDFHTDISTTYQALKRVPRLPKGYRGKHSKDSHGNFYIYADRDFQNREIINNHNGKNITLESGWGLLDPETATKGYGGFYWDDIVLDTAGTPVSVFYNDLKGEKGFTKRGAGKLVFAGNNSYRGDSIIEGGTLEVNGNNGQSIIRLNGGELTGHGTVGTVIQTGGSLNNEGNLTIDNDFSANNNSEFKAKFGNMLTINGSAALDGTISLTGEARDGIISQNGSRSTVLRAKNGIRGQYTNQRSNNPLFEITKVEYTPTADTNGNTHSGANTDVQVTARRLPADYVVRSISMMDSGARVASNLDKVLDTLDKKQETTALSTEEKAFANQVFSKFESMTIDKGINTTKSDVEPVLSEINTNQELYKLDPSVYANTAANTIDVSSTNATDLAKKLGNLEDNAIWGGATHQAYDYKLNHSTSHRKTNGINLGGGAKLDAGLTVGAQLETGELSLADSVYEVNNKTKTKMTGVTLGVSKSIADKAQLTGWVQGATTTTESTRHGQVKSGEFNGKVFGTGVQVDGKVKVGEQLEIKPYAFIGHQNYKSNDKYNDGMNTINKLTAKQIQVGVGADVAMQIAPNWEVYSGVQATNTVKKDVKLNTYYTGTDTDVEFESWDTGKNQVKATIGTNYNITPNTQIGINYNHTNGKHNDVSSVGLNFTSKF